MLTRTPGSDPPRAPAIALLMLAGLAGCSDDRAVAPGAPDASPDAASSADAPASADAPLDGPPAFAPLHLPPEALVSGAPDLWLLEETSIDTTALTIDGESNPYFVRLGAYAVLFTNELLVNDTVRVRGAAPLIVVASSSVRLRGPISVAAQGVTAGPGAVAGGAGAGTAGGGLPLEFGISSGGGGASHGTLGAPGGTHHAGSPPAGLPGALYDGQQIDEPLVGGSNGGTGGESYGGPASWGGGGGGAIQISSAEVIHVEGMGMIDAGGGGGASGGYGHRAGGGGGSGGTILLEAPVISLHRWGGLVACGGGGGSGGCGAGGCIEGTDGMDGGPCDGPPKGGLAGVPIDGVGGDGAGGLLDRYREAQPGGLSTYGGGGGGGAGVIWLRYRASTPPHLPELPDRWIVPGPRLDPTLP